MASTCDIAIIGGGAAGLTSAIFAAQSAQQSKSICILEGATTFGTKILVSGGGRCNVTHEVVHPSDFNGTSNSVRNILAAFPARATVDWFSSLGVSLKREDTGKLFPVNDSARTVLTALLSRCDALNVQRLPGHRVTAVEMNRDSSGFLIQHSRGEMHCKHLILATGGRSLPRSGSDGFGWTIAQSLGHTVSSTHAALVPLVLDSTMMHAQLTGISMPVTLSTWVDRQRIDQRTGSMLWTHTGISGPVAMDASRHWVVAQDRGLCPEMKCNLLPGENFQSLEKWLIQQANDHPKMTILNVMTQRFAGRVASAVLNKSGIAESTICGQLSRDNRRALVHCTIEMPLQVSHQRGWNYAEVTAGGVPLNEINIRTMESRRSPGLYLAGEILDCDGRIGGFNFQWAWATGFIAGRAAGAALNAHTLQPSS